MTRSFQTIVFLTAITVLFHCTLSRADWNIGGKKGVSIGGSGGIRVGGATIVPGIPNSGSNGGSIGPIPRPPRGYMDWNTETWHPLPEPIRNMPNIGISRPRMPQAVPVGQWPPRQNIAWPTQSNIPWPGKLSMPNPAPFPINLPNVAVPNITMPTLPPNSIPQLVPIKLPTNSLPPLVVIPLPSNPLPGASGIRLPNLPNWVAVGDIDMQKKSGSDGGGEGSKGGGMSGGDPFSPAGGRVSDWWKEKALKKPRNNDDDADDAPVIAKNTTPRPQSHPPRSESTTLNSSIADRARTRVNGPVSAR